ncbi:VCBS domain-containing protein [Candidatus Pelagibacter sp. HIMB1493]|uniref:VCBS domain-containing protein n=1 Tax=Candidatus Pelagibacter sp. HIMB1493 TaxID=3413334 RepID=UPI003F86ABDF
MIKKRERKQKIFIEALEQRIMLDGAGAVTFLDLIDDRNQQEIKKNSKIIDTSKENNEVPFANVARDQSRKSVVFIDSAVPDYETIISSFKENTEFYLINSNEDGFKKIDQILTDRKEIDALHIIGHGSAGEILFGNAFLNNDTIANYQATLASIGQSLTSSGDILFYGCNVASTDQGELLIKKISEITKADIAASDDVTGKGGDWVLENKFGIVETKNVQVLDYNHSLGSLSTVSSPSGTGITHKDNNVTIMDHTTNNLNVGLGSGGAYSTIGANFGIVLERENVSISSGDHISDVDVDTSDTLDDPTSSPNSEIQGGADQTASEDMTVNSYLMMHVNGADKNALNDAGEVVFGGEIVGILFDQAHTRAQTVDGNTFHSNSFIYNFTNSGGSSNAIDTDGARIIEGNGSTQNFFNSYKTSISSTLSNADMEWVSVGNHGSGTNNVLQFGSDNGALKHGDYIRILVKQSNSAPTASDGTVYINENNQVSSAGDRTPSNITKVFSASDFNFSDTDGDSLSKIQITSLESSGDLEYSTNGSTWSDVTTNLEISAANLGNGYLRFTPAANSESDVTFGFKVHDGNQYSSSAYTMTISVNAAPNVTDTTVAGTVSAGATTSSADIHDIVADSDDNDSVLVVTGVASGNESSNNTIITNNTGVGSAVTGTYGSLTVAANGTYTYTASASNNISHGSTATDTFTFTTRDNETNSGSFAYDVGTITFTVASSNNAPVAVNDTDSITEGATEDVKSDGNHLLNDDTDADSDSLVVTHIRSGSNSDQAVSSGTNYSNGTSITTSYGTLVVGADGTYRYTASGSASNALAAGATATDTFTYTISDGNGGTDTATLIYTITGVNDNPSATADTGYIAEDSTLTVADGASANDANSDGNNNSSTGDHTGDVLGNDTDADTANTLTITSITATTAGGSAQTTFTSNTETVTGSYGTLTINSNGSYSYAATSDAADALDAGDTITDVFTYIVSDGTATATSTLTITIAGINDAPVAQDDVGVIVEGGTLTVANSANANVSGSYDATGENSGDVIDTSSASHSDSDADASSSLTVTAIRKGQEGGSGDSGTVGVALTGTYGQLTIAADGSYSYIANQSAANALAAGESANDYFTYTVSDGTATDTAQITITVLGSNDAPSATADTGYIQEGKTLTVADGASANDADSSSNTNDATGDHSGDISANDTDPDTNDTLTITTYSHTSSTGQGGAAGGSNSNSGTAGTDSVVGAYGTLDLEANGSYTYTANSDITDLETDDETFTDVFTYTLSDGTTTTTATITITIEASGDVTAQNDTGTVNEDATLTVSNSGNATSVATATFSSSDSKSLSGLSTRSSGVVFNDDGTKVYTSDAINSRIYEFPLSTAFDVSTAGSSSNFSHGTIANSVSFNNDGTKMFVLQATGHELTAVSIVREYGLSTAFDVTTANTYTAGTLTTQDSVMTGLTFNNDGTKMFTTGLNNDSVYEYALSSAFDVSTLSYTDSVSVSSQDTSPQEIKFNNDGTKMYISGSVGSEIHEYTLSIAFDISSTVTYKGAYDVDPAESHTGAVGFSFNNDGTILFTTGTASAKINEHNLTTPFSLVDVSGENTGDVIDTSSGSNSDSDADSDTLTITAIRTGSSEGSGTAGTVGAALTGTYGQLTINANGSYTYVANQAAADALDPGDIVTDTFNYTVSDGNGEDDIAVLTITVVGINDAPTAVNDTDSVTAGNTVTDTTNSAGTLVSDDTDPDASSSLYITQVTPSGGSASQLTYNSTKTSNATNISGSKGTLTIGSDGSYSYAANSDATTGNDVFTYTLTDGTSTTTATLTISVTAISNNAPTASNSTVYINENNQVSSAGDRTPSNITKIFAASDFNYSDSDSDSLSKIQITTLESAGALEYSSDGSTWTDVTLNQEITATDIGNNKLRFTPAANSESDVTFGFKVHDGTEYSSSAYTMTVSVNAAPNVTDTTVAGTVAAGATTSSADIHDIVADSDDNDSVLVVTGVASGNESSNNTIITDATGVGSAVSGTYGSLTVAADGTYTYTASATNSIAFGATATDTFTFTTRDNETNSGSFAYDVGTITFTVGSSISLTDDTDSVNEDATVTKTGSQDDVLNNDTADSNGLVVTHIKKDGGSNSAVTSSSTYNSNGTSVTGTYGTLTIGADGSYTYTADQAAADALDASDQVTDVFVYTADGDTANLTITVTGVNDAPVAQDDVGVIRENATLTVANSANANVSGSYDATGEHSGDVIDTSSASHTDSDADDSASLTITEIRTGATENAGTAGTVGAALTGTYGRLTINANGSYSYVADQAAAEALDDSESAVDSFNYTLSDGTDTDFGVIRITVLGSNDAPTAVNDTDTATEGSVTTVTGSEDDVLNDDSDVDVETITVTNISHTNGNSGSVTASTTYSNGQSITGTYGTLVIGADGSYEFTPNDVLGASETGNDVFTYTVSDGTATDTATLTITTTGANDTPVADNETGAVNEDATLTVTDGTSDLLHGDTDADSSDTLTVTTYSHTSATDQDGGSASTGNGNSNTAGSGAVVGYYGTLTLAADGTYTYAADQDVADALDASDTATDVFTYTVSDGNGGTDTATLTITITGVNDDPVANVDTGAVNEDATLTVSSAASGVIQDNDTDADTDDTISSLGITTITFNGSDSAVTSGSTYNSGTPTSVTGTYGTLTIGADGTYSYIADQSAADDLDASDTATDVFTYTLSDGTGTDTATLTITVTGINDAPVAVNDTDAVNEDATVTQSSGAGLLVADDTDADDSASLTVTQIAVTGGSNSAVSSGSSYNSSGTSITGTYGTLTVGADGTYTYVADQAAADALDASDTETDSFTYTMSDGTATDTATLIITVTGVNDDPVGVADTDSVQVSSTVTDTTNSAGTVISDDTDADDSSSLTVTAIQHSGAGSATSVTAGTTRADGASSVGTYGTLTIGADGSYSYVAGSSVGTDVFTYTVSDGTATVTTTLTFTVSNGNPPVGVNDTDSVNEDATVTQSSGASLLVADDTDADGNSLTVTQIAVTGGSNSAVSSGSTYNSSGTQVTGTYGQLTVGADGSYTYTANQSAADDLDAGDTVTDSFTYTVSDGTNTDTATLIITVTGINDDPVAVNDTDAVNEDATVTHLTNSAGTLISDDTDADDSASLTVTQIAVTGGSNSSVASSSSYNSNGTSITGTYGTLTVGADGTYSYIADQSAADDLDASDTATDSFTYTMSDGTATDTATIIITVTGINDAPVAVNDTDAVNEDATVTQSSGSSLLMADDTDADDDDSFTVTQIAVTGGSNSAVTSGSSYNSNGKTVTGTYGQLTVGADGTYTYVANQSAADDLDAGDTVTDSFTYTISDGDATDTATLIITVTGVNDDPVADNETGAVNEDATLTVTDGTSDLLHGDTDADDSASLTISAIRTGAEGASGTAGSIGSGLTGTYGTLTVAADGTYTYIADQSAADDLDAGDTATDVFTYTVSDGTATDTATLTITITGVNDAPVAVNDTGAVNEDATLTVSSAASGVVQDNDTDPDTDDTAASLVVSQIAVSGGSNSAVNSGSTYNSGTPTTVTGTYGQLTIGADGTYTYVANQSAADDLDASDTATDSFTYTISDGTATDTATLIITVTGVNDVPTASNKTVTTNEDTAYVFSASDFGYTDADDDDALVSIKITTLEDAGALQYYNGSTWVDVTLNQVITATDIAANKLRFNPAADENGSSYTTFNFTVSDGDSDSATPNTITVNVTPVNDAPVADNETGAVNEDATLTVTDGTSDVLHGDTDADSDTLTVTLIGIGTNSDQAVASSSTYNSNGTTVTGTYGQLTIGADGTYTYVANQSAADDLDGSDTATDTFTYTVSDGNGGTDTATLTFTVTGVNDVPTAADNTVTTTEDTPYVFSTSDFGYTDADDDDALVSVKITTLEDDGALQYYNGTTWTDVTLNQVITTTDISNGYLRLNPDANDNGSPYTTFAFTVNDGDADSATPNTMIINVTSANDDPVADNESNSVTEGNTLTVTDGSDDLLDGDTDTEGDTLTVSGIRTGRESGSGTSGTIGSALTGTYGTLTVNSDGTYTYTPNDILGAGDTGREYFTYTVSDGNGGTDTAELAFVVTGINDDPVATNDSNTIDISTSSTLTAINNSIKDVLTNDSDVDVGDTLTVSAIRTGATEGAGTAGTIGSGLEGTYGTLTMNANGSYTYVVNAGLKDTLDPGQIVFEYFNYTLADDNSGTDTGSIIVKLQNGGAKVNEIKEQKAEKRIEKKIKKESKVTIRKLKVEGDNEAELSLNKFEFEKTIRKTSYSQGLKLVDLVAETESVQLSDGALAKVNAKEKSDALKLNFKVMNEIDNEIIKFEGKMADGSDLPSWIKVNSKTGKTTTTIPEGVDKLDIIIIATDKKNETREITIEIDPEQIKRDKQIVKVAKKVNALISVGSDGNINLIRQKADGTIDTVPTQNLNFNNQRDIKDIIEAFKPERIFQLRAINNGTDIAINLSTEILGSFERIKLVLKDGSEVPEWLEYDQATGEIIAANPPEDLSLLELKLIIERDGEIIVKDLEIDLGNTDVSEFIDLEEKNKFVAFNDQLEREFNDWDDYGNNFINRL